MYVSKVLISIKDASIYIRMSPNIIIPNNSKAKVILGIIAYIIYSSSLSNS